MAQLFLLPLAYPATTSHVYHRRLKLLEDFICHLPNQFYARILRLHEPNPPSVAPIAPLVVTAWMRNREAGLCLPPFLRVRLLVVKVDPFPVFLKIGSKVGRGNLRGSVQHEQSFPFLFYKTKDG